MEHAPQIWGEMARFGPKNTGIASALDPDMTTPLIDGNHYWLGAVWGVYRASGDYFDVGNTWVSRAKTVYA